MSCSTSLVDAREEGRESQLLDNLKTIVDRGYSLESAMELLNIDSTKLEYYRSLIESLSTDSVDKRDKERTGGEGETCSFAQAVSAAVAEIKESDTIRDKYMSLCTDIINATEEGRENQLAESLKAIMRKGYSLEGVVALLGIDSAKLDCCKKLVCAVKEPQQRLQGIEYMSYYARLDDARSEGKEEVIVALLLRLIGNGQSLEQAMNLLNIDSTKLDYYKRLLDNPGSDSNQD